MDAERDIEEGRGGNFRNIGLFSVHSVWHHVHSSSHLPEERRMVCVMTSASFDSAWPAHVVKTFHVYLW